MKQKQKNLDKQPNVACSPALAHVIEFAPHDGVVVQNSHEPPGYSGVPFSIFVSQSKSNASGSEAGTPTFGVP